MTEQSEESPDSRINVKVSGESSQALRKLTQAKGVTMAQGVNRAIQIWAFLEESRKQGAQFALVTPDGKIREVMFF